jgi:hypothetical protein
MDVCEQKIPPGNNFQHQIGFYCLKRFMCSLTNFFNPYSKEYSVLAPSH